MTPTAEDIRALHGRGIPMNKVCLRLGIGWKKAQAILAEEVTRVEMPAWRLERWETRAREIRDAHIA
jgi:hypothetical protein